MIFWRGRGVGLGTTSVFGAGWASNYNRLERSRISFLLFTSPLPEPQPWDNLLQSCLPFRKGLA